MPPMKTPAEIIEFVSVPAACAALDVRPTAIKEALRKGKLPALWYDTLEQMARRPLPRECFSFKGNPNRRPEAAE